MSQKFWFAFGDSITDMGYYIESAAETASVTPVQFGYSGWSLGIDGNGYGTLQDAVEDMIREAKKLDIETESIIHPDIITIFAGTNDFGHSGCIEGMKEGLVYIIKRLQQELPKTKLLVITPLQRNFRDGDFCGETNGLGPNKQGKYLIEYVDTIIEVAKAQDVQVLDLYRDSPVTEATADQYTIDGLHPTIAYGMELGRQIGEAIRKL